MRIQCIVLENHCNITVFWLHIGDVGITDHDAALIDFFQAGKHTKRCRLTASRWTNEDEELAILNFHVQVID